MGVRVGMSSVFVLAPLVTREAEIIVYVPPLCCSLMTVARKLCVYEFVCLCVSECLCVWCVCGGGGVCWIQ